MHVCRLQGRLKLIAPNAAERTGVPQQHLGLLDHGRVPALKRLLGQRHVLTVHTATRAAPRFAMQHERE